MNYIISGEEKIQKKVKYIQFVETKHLQLKAEFVKSNHLQASKTSSRPL
jgi:hypothetical protein